MVWHLMIKQRSRLHFFVQVITIDELLNMMSVFIEIGEGKGHKVIYDYLMVLILHFLNWAQHFAKNYDSDMQERKKFPIWAFYLLPILSQVDLATVMAEMFKIGDRNKDDVLTRWMLWLKYSSYNLYLHLYLY